MKRSVMWWDWSSSAQVSTHDRCSERQFVNSGFTGKVLGGKLRFLRSSTGLPARASAAARLSVDMGGRTSHRDDVVGAPRVGGVRPGADAPGSDGRVGATRSRTSPDLAGGRAPPAGVVVRTGGLRVRRRAHHGAHGDLLVRLDGGL